MPRVIAEDRFRSAYLLVESSQDFRYESLRERLFWEGVAFDILNDHVSGKKKTAIAEAALRYAIESVDVITEEDEKKSEPGIFKKAMLALGKVAAVTAKGPQGQVKSRNWWLFGGGGDKETAKYKQAYDDAIDKRNEVIGKVAIKSIKEIETEIKSKNKDFPNGGSKEDFESAIKAFVDTYVKIANAAGTEVPNVDTKAQSVNLENPIPVDDANAAIADLRKVMMFYDRELKDRYTYRMDHHSRSGPRLAEVLELDSLNEIEVEDIGKEGQKTSGMKGLESNVAPGILAALGAIGVGFAWLAKQSWFLEMFREPQKIIQIVKWVKEGGSKTGVSSHLGVLMGRPGENISGMKVIDFMSEMAKRGLVKDGMPTGNLLQLAKDAGNAQFADWWKSNLAGPTHANQSLAQAIPLSGSGAPGAGGDIFTGSVMKPVIRAVAQGGGGSAVAMGTVQAAGYLSGMLGAGALASAVTIKALRMYGAENSRSSYIQAAKDMMKDVKEPPKKEEEDRPPIPDPPTGKKITVTLENRRTLFQWPQEGGKPASPFTMPGYERKPGIPISIKGDEDLKKMCVLILQQDVIAKAVTGIEGDVNALQKYTWDFIDKRTEKDKGDEGDEGDRGKPKLTTPGEGTPSVIAIKDISANESLRMDLSLRAMMLEDADIRKIGSSKRRTKSAKALKQKMKDSSGQLPFPKGASTVEKNVMNDYMQMKDGDFDLQATASDNVVQGGLNSLRKRAKSGNVVLTFSTSTIKKLKSFGIDDEKKRQEILKIYAKNPDSAPDDVAAYKRIYSKLDSSKQEDFKKYLYALGLVKKKKEEKSKKAAPKGKSEGVEEAQMENFNFSLKDLIREIVSDS